MGRRTLLMRAMRELVQVHSALPGERPVSLDEAIELSGRPITRRQLLKEPASLGRPPWSRVPRSPVWDAPLPVVRLTILAS